MSLILLRAHHLLHQLKMMIFVAFASTGETFWTAVVSLVFAAAFLVVGVHRVVELKGLGFSKKRLWLLTFIHVFGCFSFSFCLALFALDVHMLHKDLLSALFAVSFLTLVPMQIYLALLRRVRLQDR